jgi:RNA polymerase sigma factor (sigma-70 family)
MEQDPGDRQLLERLAQGGPAAWDLFLEGCSGVVFGVVRLFADTYDDRMDLFLFICARLQEGDMRRLRAFRFRADAPCRFSTWLTVVARNLALDFVREREGRFRPFQNVVAMDAVDRLVFEYHLRDGLPLDEVRDRLRQQHDVHLEEHQLVALAARVAERISPSQRWRLLSRLMEKRRPLPVDPVAGSAMRGEERIPIPDDWGDPERPLRTREAERALQQAMELLPPRERLVVMLRFRDGMTARETADVTRITVEEAERLSRLGINRLRESLSRTGLAPTDFETSSLAGLWTS